MNYVMLSNIYGGMNMITNAISTHLWFSTRHDNDNCDLTIQAVATCRFMDTAHKLRKRYSNISQILWSDDLSFNPIAAR